MKVSVSITAHNREDFIREAIDSVLMQETKFDYEIVIGEDCSTDRTRDVVLSYQGKYPNKIRVLLHEKNLGLNKNFVAVIQSCRGQYIALLDDDDYWTSPQKLQKQVDFLDAHPECSMCFHDSRHFHEDGTKEDAFIDLPRQREIFHLEDLRWGPFIPTSSTMYRHGIFGEFPRWFSEMNAHDWPLHILNAQCGSLGYIDETLSATRIHQGGDWNGRNTIEQYKYAIKDCEILTRHIPPLKKHIAAKLAQLYFEWAAEAARQGKRKEARTSFMKSIMAMPFPPGIRNLDRIKLLTRVSIPGLQTWLAQPKEESSTKA